MWVVVYDHHLTAKHREEKMIIIISQYIYIYIIYNHYCIDYPHMVASQPIREMNIHEQATTFAFIFAKSIDIFFTMKGSDFKKIEFVI